MRDDGQRHIRKRLQEPLCRRLVGHLLLVFWVQTGECGLLLLQRPPQQKLQDRQHADPERQQVREALNLLVALDKERRDMDGALETVENGFNTVFVGIAKNRILQRYPRWNT